MQWHPHMCDDAVFEEMTREDVDGSSTTQGPAASNLERARVLDRLASFGLAEDQPPLFVSTDLAKRRLGSP